MFCNEICGLCCVNVDPGRDDNGGAGKTLIEQLENTEFPVAEERDFQIV